MKAALIVSGYSRGFDLNLESYEKSILTKFNQIDAYVHLTRGESSDDKYMNFHNLSEVVEKNISLFSPKSLLVESNQIYSHDTAINNLYNNWSKFYKLNQIKNLSQGSVKYDIVIKTRPDLRLVSEDLFDNIRIEKNKIYIPKSSKIDKSKLSNPEDPFICDSFAFGGEYEMSEYFKIYEKLEYLVDKFGGISETILYHHLEESGLNVVKLDIEYEIILSGCNIFAICGDSGTGKSTLSEMIKDHFNNSFVLECDRYHKWERGNENWKRITHLNPGANYISKMNEDIFNLKVGKSIYQVNYDHTDGKFTESEKIESTDNLIVCGLHSLYNTNEDLYDIKIFMDPQEDLKKKWKIERDISHRGYTREKIEKQIEDRKEDYKKFILPQKNWSDVIISFLKIEDSIGLKVHIRNNLRLNNILEIFNSNKISVEIERGDKFNTLFFETYLPINLWRYKNVPIYNNFYDYIIFIILNLKKTP